MAEEQLDLNLPVASNQKKRDEWAKKIKEYEKSFEKWEKDCNQIVMRYRDEKNTDDLSARVRRYNIFWSNVETLGPAVFSRPPKPEVTRRYFDKDPIGRLASAVLERSLQYEMDVTDFFGETMLCRDDYLIVGRGTLWQRYEPLIEQRPAQDADGEEGDEQGPGGNSGVMNEAKPGVQAIGANGGPPMEEEVIGENAPTDYVHWKDFMHGPAQNWKQVPWVGRWVLMDRASVDRRWPQEDEAGHKASYYMSFTHKQEKDDNKQKTGSTIGNLARVAEIWDKTTFTVKWFSHDLKERLIEEVPDFLQLNDFFPCPEPLYATMTTDRLVPRADYQMYQDQAIELDVLTQRIGLLLKAVAVRGVYDGSNTKLADLLNERPENFMVPVDNWAAFAEKGGLQGQMSFVPIDQVIKVITELQAARTVVINDIYQITGISDIVRGQGEASETATAQNIKGQFANLRLNSRRDKMAKFLRESLRIKAEVMAEHFDQSILRKISGFDQMTEVTTAKATGQDPDQLWQQVYDMLKNDPLRLTHLDVETDSMIDTDMQQEQQSRVAFLQAVGGFLTQAVQIGQQVPAIIPLIGQMISFGVRGFKIGRELEASIDAAMEKLEQMAANPQPPPPNPETIRAQAEQMKIQQQGEAEQARNAAEVQAEQNAFAIKKLEIESAERIAIFETSAKFGIAATEQAADATEAERQRLHEATQNEADRNQQQDIAAAQPETQDAA